MSSMLVGSLAFYAERMLRATAAAVDVGIHWKK